MPDIPSFSDFANQNSQPAKPAGKARNLRDRNEVARIVDEELRSLGWNENARLALVSNMGRENSWNVDTIFGTHTDPASFTNGRGKITNRGIISWNDTRRTDLDSYLTQNGVLGKSDENELRGMVRFLDHEMQNSRDPRVRNWQKINRRMKDPNLSLDEAYPLLQQYILYQKQYEPHNKEWEAKAAKLRSNNSFSSFASQNPQFGAPSPADSFAAFAESQQPGAQPSLGIPQPTNPHPNQRAQSVVPTPPAQPAPETNTNQNSSSIEDWGSKHNETVEMLNAEKAKGASADPEQIKILENNIGVYRLLMSGEYRVDGNRVVRIADGSSPIPQPPSPTVNQSPNLKGNQSPANNIPPTSATLRNAPNPSKDATNPTPARTIPQAAESFESFVNNTPPNQNAPAPNAGRDPQMIEARNEDEILEGAASSVRINLRDKPAGENPGKFILRTALTQIAPEYGFSQSEIENYLSSGKAPRVDYYNDLDDAQFDKAAKSLESRKKSALVNFTVKNRIVNDLLLARTGETGLSGNLRNEINFKGAQSSQGQDQAAAYSREAASGNRVKNDLRESIVNPSFSQTIEDGLTNAITKTGAAVLNPVGAFFDEGARALGIIKDFGKEKDVDGLTDKAVQNIERQYGSFGNYERVQKYAREMSFAEASSRRFAGYMRGVVNTAISSNLKGLDVVDSLIEKISEANPFYRSIPEKYRPTLRTLENGIGYTIASLLGKGDKFESATSMTSVDQRLFFNIGKELEKSLGEEKYLKETLGYKLSESLGSATGFLLLGLLAPEASIGKGLGTFSITSGAMGALGEAGSMYDETRQKGRSERESLLAGLVGLPIGASEGFGVGSALNKAFQPMEKRAFTKILAEFLSEGIEEGGQETFQGVSEDAFYSFLEDRSPSLAQKFKNAISNLPAQISKNVMDGGFTAFLTGGVFGKGVELGAHLLPVQQSENESELDSPAIQNPVNQAAVPQTAPAENASSITPPASSEPVINESPESAPENRPLSESRFTIAKQIESALRPDSPRAGVLITNDDHLDMASALSNDKFVPIPTGQGVLLVNSEKARALGLNSHQDIYSYVAENGFESLIGKVEPVEDTSQGVTVRTEDEQGRELSTSVVTNPQAAKEQMDRDLQEFGQDVARQEVIPTPMAAEKRAAELETEIQEAQTETSLNKFLSSQPKGRLQQMQETADDSIKSGQFSTFVDPEGISEKDQLKIDAYNDVLKSKGFQLGEIKFNKNSHTVTSEILPFEGNKNLKPNYPGAEDVYNGEENVQAEPLANSPGNGLKPVEDKVRSITNSEADSANNVQSSATNVQDSTTPARELKFERFKLEPRVTSPSQKKVEQNQQDTANVSDIDVAQSQETVKQLSNKEVVSNEQLSETIPAESGLLANEIDQEAEIFEAEKNDPLAPYSDDTIKDILELGRLQQKAKKHGLTRLPVAERQRITRLNESLERETKLSNSQIYDLANNSVAGEKSENTPVSENNEPKTEKATQKPQALPENISETWDSKYLNPPSKTTTGRDVSSFPKFDADSRRKGINTETRIDNWLAQNALDEAKARGDRFNERTFETQIGKNLTVSDRETAFDYLFNEDWKDVGQAKPAVQPTPEPVKEVKTSDNVEKKDAPNYDSVKEVEETTDDPDNTSAKSRRNEPISAAVSENQNADDEKSGDSGVSAAGVESVERNGVSETTGDEQTARTSDDLRESVGQRAIDAGGEHSSNSVRSGGTIGDSVAPARNFVITDELAEKFSPKAQFKKNTAAIRLVKILAGENRQATPEEQKILAQYVGWGGLPQAFDPNKKDWSREYEEVKNLLTEEEYDRARRSTLDAHYTSKTVVDGMWNAVARLGFKNGGVIESSMGSGNFFGTMPVEMRKGSKLTGIELDNITSAIAQQLYPEANIYAARGFQTVNVGENRFDLAIGNPPFGPQPLTDDFNKDLSFNIHGFFFAKNIESVRPGGIMALVVSRYWMDNMTNGRAARQFVADRAKLLGAIRLPNNAFKGNANTDVVTDIIFLQKLQPGETGNAETWMNSAELGTDEKTGLPIKTNQYFADNPHMILGSSNLQGKMSGRENEYTVSATGDLNEQLSEAIKNLPENVFEKTNSKAFIETADNLRVAPEHLRAYSFAFENNRLNQVFAVDKSENGKVTKTNVLVDVHEAYKPTEIDRLKPIVEIRDCIRAIYKTEQEENASETGLQNLRKNLNDAYDAFVKKFGFLSSDYNKRIFKSDIANFPLLLSLEVDYDKGISKDVAKKEGVDARAASAKKAAIFYKRTIQPDTESSRTIETPQDALLYSLNNNGKIDVHEGAELLDVTPEEYLNALGELAYLNPKGNWETSDEYLSGDVKTKLEEAEAAAKTEPALARNVQALKKVVPEDVSAYDLTIRVNEGWIPEEVHAAFIKHLIKGDFKGAFDPTSGQWFTSIQNVDKVANDDTWGTPRKSAVSIMEALFAGKRPIVFDYVSDGKGGSRAVLNADDTAAAERKAVEIEREWVDWLYADDTRRDALASLYNSLYNRYVNRTYDGAHLKLTGKVSDSVIELRPHQKNAIWRAIQKGKGLFNHVVGAGKSFVMIAAGMEMRRLGLMKKPIYVVPNHLVEQFGGEFLRLYPNANVLIATKKDFQKANRKNLFARIAAGDWDAVVVAHSSFGFIQLPVEEEFAILEEQKRDLEWAIESARSKDSKSFSIKDLERIKDKVDEKIKKLSERSRDDFINFAEMGIDGIFVDESHEYKNLFYTTTRTGVKGMGNPAGSNKAFDMFAKTQYVLRKNNNRNIFFATGTPIANTLVEIFHVQRYLQYDLLKKLRIHTADSWLNTFGEESLDFELNPAGGFTQKNRLAKIKKKPELKKFWNEDVDTIRTEDLIRDAELQGKRFPLPNYKRQRTVAPRSPLQSEFIGIPQTVRDEHGAPVLDPETQQPKVEFKPGTIVDRLQNWAMRREEFFAFEINGKVFTRRPGQEIPLAIANDARKAGLDYRLIDDTAPDFPDSKINQAVRKTVETYNKWNHVKGTQLLFCDLSVPAKHRGAATKAAQDKVPQFFIKNFKNQLTAVTKAVGAKLSAMPDLEFFTLKDGKNYRVYEKSSGVYITTGYGAKDSAINDANARLASNPENWRAEFAAAAIPAEELEAYLLEYLEAQERAKEESEVSGDESEKDSSVKISLDELLADSGDSNFSVYDDVRAKLIAQGIPANEIAFIHDYQTDLQKKTLFAKMNRGDIRILMGSTAKMGAGMNVQERLVRLANLDSPYRPSDMEQRVGRIVRQGNKLFNPEKDVFNDDFYVEIDDYATEKTYDARMYEIIEQKGKGFDNFYADDGAREIEDISEETASYEEMKAEAVGDPRILQSFKLKKDLKDLEGQYRSWQKSRGDRQRTIAYVREGNTREQRDLKDFKEIRETVKKFPAKSAKLEFDTSKFTAEEIRTSDDKKNLAQAGLIARLLKIESRYDASLVGTYRGGKIVCSIMKFEGGKTQYNVGLEYDGQVIVKSTYNDAHNASVLRLINNFDEAIDLDIHNEIKRLQKRVSEIETEAEERAKRLNEPFKYQEELNSKRQALDDLLQEIRGAVKGQAVEDATEQETGLKSAAFAPAQGSVFYSQLAKTIGEKMPNKAASAQIKAIVENNGVKREELDWLGFDEFLSSKDVFTKTEVLDFIKSNQVELRETVKDTQFADDNEQWRETKYEQYTLPGGENYKELLLTLPTTSPNIETFDAFWQKMIDKYGADVVNDDLNESEVKQLEQISNDHLENPPETYASSHYKEPNILAHIRFNERTDEKGNRTLFLEEIQSDWHQEGRKNGYKGAPVVITKLPANYRVEKYKNSGVYAVYKDDEMVTSGDSYEDAEKRAIDQINGYTLFQTNMKGAPNAPFKKNWQELAFKRALRYAVENGFDSIGWTTGTQQADRYDLSKQVDRIEWTRSSDNSVIVRAVKNENYLPVFDGEQKRNAKLSDLDAIIGKDASEKIKQGFAAGKYSGALSGDDLKVGGSGMIGFYDKIIPSFVSKYVKKWGAKVGSTEIKTGAKPGTAKGVNIYKTSAGFDVYESANKIETFADLDKAKLYARDLSVANEYGGKYRVIDTRDSVYSVEITDSMRESVMSGQPLFSKDVAGKSWSEIVGAKLGDLIAPMRANLDGDGSYRIQLNAEGAEFLRRVYQEVRFQQTKKKHPEVPFTGFFDFITSDSGKEFAARAVKFIKAQAVEAKALGYSPQEIANISNYATVIEQAAKNGNGAFIYYVDDKALPEEEFHRAGFVAFNGQSLKFRHADFEVLANDKLVKNYKKKYAVYLNEFAADMRDAVAIEETAAVFARGGYAEIGASEDEAVEYLANFFESQAKRLEELGIDIEKAFSNYNAVTEKNVRETLKQSVAKYRRIESRAGSFDERSGASGEESGETSGTNSGISPPENGGSGKLEEPTVKREGIASLPETLRGAGYDAERKTYEVLSNSDVKRAASHMADAEDAESELNHQLNSDGEMSPYQTAFAIELITRLSREARTAQDKKQLDVAKAKRERVAEIVDLLDEKLRQAGRAIQAVQLLEALDPDSIIAVGARRKARMGDGVLSEAEAADLTEKAKELETANVALDELQKKYNRLEKRFDKKRAEEKEETRKKRRAARRGAPSVAAQKVIQKLAVKEDAILEKFRQKFNVPVLLKSADVTGLKSAATSVLTNEELSELSDFGALEYARGFRKLGSEVFKTRLEEIFGPAIVPFADEIFSRSVIKYRQMMREARYENELEKLQAQDGNESLTRQQLERLYVQKKSNVRAAQNVMREHLSEAKRTLGITDDTKTDVSINRVQRSLVENENLDEQAKMLALVFSSENRPLLKDLRMFAEKEFGISAAEAEKAVDRAIAAIDDIKREMKRRSLENRNLDELEYKRLQEKKRDALASYTDAMKRVREKSKAEGREYSNLPKLNKLQRAVLAEADRRKLAPITKNAAIMIAANGAPIRNPKTKEVTPMDFGYNKISNRIKEMYKPITQKDADKHVLQAVEFIRDVRGIVRDEQVKTREAKNPLTTEEKRNLDAAFEARRKALVSIQTKLKQLGSRPTGYPGRARRIWKGLLISAWKTAFNNAVSGGATLATRVLTDELNLGYRKILTKFNVDLSEEGLNPKTGFGDVLAYNSFRVLRSRRMAQGILDRFPAQFEQLFGRYNADIEAENSTNERFKVGGVPVGEGVNKTFEAAEWFVDKINIFNQVQEFSVRSVEFVRQLNKILAGKNISLETEWTNRTLENHLTEDDLEKAINAALEVTFAARPDANSLVGTVARKYEEVMNNSILAVFAPLEPALFANFMYNAGKFITDHNPFLHVGKNAALVLSGKKEYSTEDFAKATTGLFLFALALAGVRAFGGDDDRWYVWKVAGVPIDLRGYQPFASFVYYADIGNRVLEGRTPIESGKEFIEQSFGLSTRAVIGNPGLEMLNILSDYAFLNKPKSGERAEQLARSQAGSLVGAPFNFMRPLKDLTASVVESEGVEYDYTDAPTLGEIHKRLPMSSMMWQYAPKKDYVTGEIQRRRAPYLGLFGMTPYRDNQIIPKESVATEAAGAMREPKNRELVRLPAEQRKSDAIRSIIQAQTNGIDATAAIKRAEKDGIIDDKLANTFLNSAGKSPLARKIDQNRLSLDEKKALLPLANKAEKPELEKMIERGEATAADDKEKESVLKTRTTADKLKSATVRESVVIYKQATESEREEIWKKIAEKAATQKRAGKLSDGEETALNEIGMSANGVRTKPIMPKAPKAPKPLPIGISKMPPTVKRS